MRGDRYAPFEEHQALKGYNNLSRPTDLPDSIVQWPFFLAVSTYAWQWPECMAVSSDFLRHRDIWDAANLRFLVHLSLVCSGMRTGMATGLDVPHGFFLKSSFLGLPVPFLLPFFGWEGSPTKIDRQKKGCPSLSSQIWRT